MMVVIQKVKDRFGKILIVGGVALFSTQFVFNLGMISGIFPLVGMPLPFIKLRLDADIIKFCHRWRCAKCL